VTGKAVPTLHDTWHYLSAPKIISSAEGIRALASDLKSPVYSNF